jgi:hypothetical protein
VRICLRRAAGRTHLSFEVQLPRFRAAPASPPLRPLRLHYQVIAERAAQVGGSITSGSRPGHTRLEIDVPDPP